ncbi:ParB/RepB/Spo0J family partition protein [Pelomicrobium methylotrophicum]|uniref:ParB/RepB/Spo0J family partition protein n=1 Tax=Pelomicrobium methylotrophicum TaxID=2602750 RepID=A0A5C7EXQ9_9PROT|nr:ParB/RepB/Spo0J family partition protein [Pelomicrobium methylotrophicum]TXF13262.1 ParB/RepB/Spo0J family partition protein [Pelomicrobium methylotrophicum]
MAKMKGLGRGLDALLGGGQEMAAPESARTLPVTALRPGRYQPRSRMDPESLQALAESIKAQGVVQPILVRPLSDGHYEIVAGERRWRAAQLAGLAEIPAVVREVPDEAALAMALIENIQREDLNPLEQARGIQRLIEEFGMTHQQAAQAVGYSRSAVSNLLRLLNLAQPVQELLLEGKLDMGHARALLALSAAQQVQTARLVVAKQLSVRDTERLVQKRLAAPEAPKRRADRDVRRLEEEVSEAIGAAVEIRPGPRGRGRLIIHYGTLEQLEDLLARLRGTGGR